MSEYSDWLATLKIGDKWEAIVYSKFGFREIKTVAKLEIIGETRTQWKVGNSRYRKSDGRIVGSEYGILPMPSTEKENNEVREKLDNMMLLNRLKYEKWESMPMHKLKRIKSILDET